MVLLSASETLKSGAAAPYVSCAPPESSPTDFICDFRGQNRQLETADYSLRYFWAPQLSTVSHSIATLLRLDSASKHKAAHLLFVCLFFSQGSSWKREWLGITYNRELKRNRLGSCQSPPFPQYLQVAFAHSLTSIQRSAHLQLHSFSLARPLESPFALISNLLQSTSLRSNALFNVSPEASSCFPTSVLRNQEHKSARLHALSTRNNPHCLIIHSNTMIKLLNNSVHFSFVLSLPEIRKCNDILLVKIAINNSCPHPIGSSSSFLSWMPCYVILSLQFPIYQLVLIIFPFVSSKAILFFHDKTAHSPSDLHTSVYFHTQPSHLQPRTCW